MKKAALLKGIFLMILIAGSTFTADAQKKKWSGGAKPAFDVKSKTLGIFFGVGVNYDYTGYGYWNDHPVSPAVGIIYDQGIIGNAGPGTIGIGGVLAFKASHSNFYGDKDYYRSIIIGVRGTYHLTILKNKNNKFDPYGGVTVGARISHYSNNYDNYTDNTADPFIGVFVGAKYNFSRNVGVFSELGYDVSFFKIGINFNF